VSILYDGKPLPNAAVKAIYEGFAGKPHTYPHETTADDKGEANVNLDKKGFWLISVTYEIPYPDKDECDKYRYNQTFTFNVK
jgi:uncharacterized GH25 family protein